MNREKGRNNKKTRSYNRTSKRTVEVENLGDDIMGGTRFCLQCSATIGVFDKQCKYCGTNQFGENNEFYPDEKMMRKAKKFWGSIFSSKKKKKEKSTGLSVEQQFIMGIHPNDEMYRRTLEFEILTKNYKNNK